MKSELPAKLEKSAWHCGQSQEQDVLGSGVPERPVDQIFWPGPAGNATPNCQLVNIERRIRVARPVTGVEVVNLHAGDNVRLLDPDYKGSRSSDLFHFAMVDFVS